MKINTIVNICEILLKVITNSWDTNQPVTKTKKIDHQGFMKADMVIAPIVTNPPKIVIGPFVWKYLPTGSVIFLAKTS